MRTIRREAAELGSALDAELLLADSIDQVAQLMRKKPDDHGGTLSMDPITPEDAAGRIHEALQLTDMTIGAPVGEDFQRLRAVALCRADEASGQVAVPERAELPGEERDRLRGEFLASPEGRCFAADSDEAFIASLAIDFCAGYVDGRPLRWSPVVVELFMADWLPRKVLAGPELFQHVPRALEAWVGFAARKRGTPAWAAELTKQAIPRWTGAMLERAG